VNKPGANGRVSYETLSHSRHYSRDRGKSRSWIKNTFPDLRMQRQPKHISRSWLDCLEVSPESWAVNVRGPPDSDTQLVVHNGVSMQERHTPKIVPNMGGASAQPWYEPGTLPTTLQRCGRRGGVKIYIVYILCTCNKKYTSHAHFTQWWLLGKRVMYLTLRQIILYSGLYGFIWLVIGMFPGESFKYSESAGNFILNVE